MKRSGTERKRAGGLSLVELIVGMSAASIIAVTLALMAAFAYATWARNARAATLQRDATLAMQKLLRVLREATPGGLDLSQPNRIVFTTNGVTQTFYERGGDLVYASDAGAGAELAVVQGRLVPGSLSGATNIPRGVSVSFQLRDGAEVMHMQGAIRLRN